MSKAFDTANHAKLLRKLHQYGFGGNNIKPLTCDFRGPTGSTLGPMLFLLYVNSWPDAVRSSQIAAFADDAKIFKEITSTRDSEQLQEDLFNLVTRSDSASLNFNYRKCKAQPITRTLKPVIFVYHMAGSQLEVVCAEKDLSREISKSMCNALRPAGSWDMYGELLDSSKALRLDAGHTLS